MIANLIARLLIPRLSKVDPKTLKKIKLALNDFDARSKKWKSEIEPKESLGEMCDRVANAPEAYDEEQESHFPHK